MLLTTISYAQVATVENSPYTYKNSKYNYDNSPYNYANSPYNPSNSPYNLNAPNAIYDNKGRRTGYTTRSDSGTVNYYDNNGYRKGYSSR